MAASWDGCFLKWLLREMAVSWDGCFLRCLLLTFSLCKTPFGETGCLDNLCFCLLVAYASSFLIHPNTVSSVTYGYHPSLCSTCVTYRTLYRAIGHQVLPTQPLPREAEDFPRSGNHSKHMPLLTYLAWLQPIFYNSKLIFICVNAAKFLRVVKILMKKL